MRHDPAAGAIVIMLRSLKMCGMAQAVTDLIEQGAPAFEAAIPMLSQLLKAELAEREVRSIAYHMRSARFPAYKDLSGFDFAASEINERGAALAAINPATIYGGGAEGYTDYPTLSDDCRRAPDSQWFASRHRRRRRLARTDRRWRYGSRSCSCGQRCGDG